MQLFDIIAFREELEALLNCTEQSDATEQSYFNLVCYVKKLVDQFPVSSELWCLLGKVERLSELHNCEFSVAPKERFEKAMELDPLNATASFELADLLAVDDPASAIPRYEQSVNCKESVGAFLGLVYCYFEAGDREKVRDNLSFARRLAESYTKQIESCAADMGENES